MQLSLFFSVFALLLSHGLVAQNRLLLAGNTADAGADFYRAVEERLRADDAPGQVLLVGDFVPECTGNMLAYKANAGKGTLAFPTVAPVVALARAYPQVAFYLIPGDRDWDISGDKGLDCVKRLEAYLAAQSLENLHWPLKNGCPGPELIDISERLSLLLFNTQWWNHPYDKPQPRDADCSFAESEVAIDEALAAIRENRDRNLIVAGHFPPASQGRSGGEFPVVDQFRPPLIGSLLLSWRQNVGTPAELYNRRMASLHQAFRNHSGRFEGMIFVGAQDRSQQLLNYRSNYIINAGAAGPGEWVADHAPALHTSRAAGFTELLFAADGAVSYQYQPVGEVNPAFQRSLYLAPCGRALTTIPVNPAFGPCAVSGETLTELCAIDAGEQTVITPGPTYGRGKLGELLLGKHYRDTWTTPVTIPVYLAAQLRGGLRPLHTGGGLQTTSLRLADTLGREYNFRPIDKTPRRVLDFSLRNTFVGDILEDQTTIGHPFGPLVASPLMDSLDILHLNPELLYLANCPSLGDFNMDFGGQPGMLEPVPKGEKKKKGIPGAFGAKEIHKSYEAFRMRYDDQEVTFAHREFLRARLFDLLIGDWNRHENNWRWAEYEEEGIKVLRPVPRDRDNAFSLIDGFGPWFASKVFLTRLEHFGFDEPDAGSLSYQSRHLDRFLLSPLQKADYLAEAAAIQRQLTDSLIEVAIRKMPAEAFAVSGAKIVAKLKARRDALPAYAEAFYLRYAEVVDVVGTNDEEAFSIHFAKDGRVRIRVKDVKGRSEGEILYERIFDPEETREIRLYGLGDADVFRLDTTPCGPIDVRVIGGPGRDMFYSVSEPSRKRISVYERSASADGRAPAGMRFRRSYRDYLYAYDRTSVEFNKVRPVFGAGFNSVNGVSLGAGLKYTRYNFFHRPYAARYRVYAETNFAGNFFVDMAADFPNRFRKVDVLARMHYGAPDIYRFFFGIGNEAPFLEGILDRNAFNAVFLENLTAEVGFRRRFAGRSMLRLLGGMQVNRTVDRKGTILDGDTRFFGDGNLTYAYVQPTFTLDLRDHDRLPSKGILLEASHKRAWNPDGEGNFGVTRLAGEIHFSPRNTPASLSFRAGFASSTGRVPFYELPTLGRDNGLRGYQRRRFAGDGYVFYNSEIRTPVANISGRFIPTTIGVRAFYDRGRLLMSDEEERGMRDAWGFGIYLVPLKKKYTVTATVGFSGEERRVFIIGGGVNFNRE